MEVEIKGKKFQIRELSYLELVFDLPKIIDIKDRHTKMLELSGIPFDIINTLTFKEGKEVVQKIHELNGLIEDFQKTSKSEGEN